MIEQENETGNQPAPRERIRTWLPLGVDRITRKNVTAVEDILGNFVELDADTECEAALAFEVSTVFKATRKVRRTGRACDVVCDLAPSEASRSNWTAVIGAADLFVAILKVDLELGGEGHAAALAVAESLHAYACATLRANDEAAKDRQEVRSSIHARMDAMQDRAFDASAEVIRLRSIAARATDSMSAVPEAVAIVEYVIAQREHEKTSLEHEIKRLGNLHFGWSEELEELPEPPQLPIVEVAA